MWLYRKQGFPEKGDVVLCNVDRIGYHSVFVTLIEYDNLRGLIKISEISPGRIRNIRDFVKEKSIVVCKVIYINNNSNLLEVSLRRVNTMQRRAKLNEMKEEQLAEKIISNVAKKLEIETENAYSQIQSKLSKSNVSLFQAFQQYIDNTFSLDDFDIESKILKTLKDEISKILSPTKVVLKGKYYINSYDSEGVNIIKNAFRDAATDDFIVGYHGAGIYDVSIESKDYKVAEKKLDDFKQRLESSLEKNSNTFFEFKKE